MNNVSEQHHSRRRRRRRSCRYKYSRNFSSTLRQKSKTLGRRRTEKSAFKKAREVLTQIWKKTLFETIQVFVEMESVRAVVYLSVCLTVMTSVCQGQRSSENQQLSEPALGLTTNELAEALQGLLDEADSNVGLSVEKKASVIPRCDVGERCAMKHGPRIGRLCDCLRGTACNTFFLRCY
ncbi:hypothetical protein OJAV_G00114180 [Oryzias javanicus]|uniref:Uncharacterized protein n=1 Tax=Oryzias javanicus TaxID=123683 RepID=A0A437CWW0_ORYJA|nr:hypothetical protein OJAV_G00114180 [Oryzias javanicus]